MQNPVSVYDSMTKMTSISLTVCVRHFNDTIVVLFDTKMVFKGECCLNNVILIK